MLHRLRSDFQLAIVTLFGACAMLGILPLAVYRVMSGMTLVAVLDVALLAVIAGCVGYAWHSGDTRRTGLALMLATTAGALAVAHLIGVDGVFWVYALVLANFFLLRRSAAIFLTALTLLVLALHPGVFPDHGQRLSFLLSALVASLFAYIFAARTERQRLELLRLATRDPLTGAANRRAMEEELQVAVEAHRRGAGAFGLMLLDLDHFKRINDRYGHEAGDQVLVGLAELVRESTRKVDRLFRFGGEEFVLLLPGADAAALGPMTAALLSSIRSGLQGDYGSVTASLGAAALQAGEDWQSWLARADAAMYRAKEGGRDRAVVDSGDAAD